MNNDVMTIPLEKGLAIEPGKILKLSPGSYHLMIINLKRPLKQGDKVPVRFEVTLSLDVQGVGAQAPSGGSHSGGYLKSRRTIMGSVWMITAGVKPDETGLKAA